MFDSDVITDGVRVKVCSQYIPTHSNPDQSYWFFIYTVDIHNEGEETVRLMERHWIITDAEGKKQEIKGEGVVGEQPVLMPGQSFQYTSSCPLPTPFGSMRGSYHMVSDKGRVFDAQIANFSLMQPNVIN